MKDKASKYSRQREPPEEEERDRAAPGVERERGKAGDVIPVARKAARVNNGDEHCARKPSQRQSEHRDPSRDAGDMRTFQGKFEKCKRNRKRTTKATKPKTVSTTDLDVAPRAGAVEVEQENERNEGERKAFFLEERIKTEREEWDGGQQRAKGEKSGRIEEQETDQTKKGQKSSTSEEDKWSKTVGQPSRQAGFNVTAENLEMAKKEHILKANENKKQPAVIKEEKTVQDTVTHVLRHKQERACDTDEGGRTHTGEQRKKLRAVTKRQRMG
ncbi:hypothetical protein Tco_0594764 [Tanacetum coccineum]